MRTKERAERDYKSHRKWVEKNLERYRAYHKKYNALESTKKRRRERYQSNKKHHRELDRVHYHKNEERHRELWASKKYGISVEEYRLLNQKEVCDICQQKEMAIGRNGKIKRLAIDHNHETGKVRGLLCQKCNQAVGLLREDIDLVEKVKDYLNANTTKHNFNTSNK